MMTLTELLETQKELNSHCEDKPTQEQLLMAIVAECGELAQALKGDWCWWKRNGKGFEVADRDTIAAELADILCFLLTGCLSNEQTAGANTYWDAAWDSLYPRSPITELIRFASIGQFMSAIGSFGSMCQVLNFSQTEIEAAYLRKVEVNKARWA